MSDKEISVDDLVANTQTVMVPLKDIKLNPKNRNTHPPEQIDRLVKLIKYTKFRRPVTISNRSGQLSCGEGRYLAAKKIGMKAIPAMFQDYDDEAQEYADSIADNQADKWAIFEMEQVQQDVLDLGPDFDLDMLGIEDFFLPNVTSDGPKEDREKEPKLTTCPSCGEEF